VPGRPPVGSYFEVVDFGSVGETVLPYTPGLGIPAGDVLCAASVNGVDVGVTVTGYNASSNEVPSSVLHRTPTLPRQRS